MESDYYISSPFDESTLNDLEKSNTVNNLQDEASKSAKMKKVDDAVDAMIAEKQ